jgi:16S rRNA processing protein RimM
VKNQDQDLLAVGRIVKAFGLRGEVVVESLADSPERFRRLRSVLLGPDAATARRTRITRTAVEARGVRVALADISDRTAAEKIVGHFLFVDAQHRVKLPPGRHFVHQVVGLTVLDQDGAVVGCVRDVLKLPAHDVYVIERNGREILIPAVREFVLSINLEEGILRVHLIEGMVEE